MTNYTDRNENIAAISAEFHSDKKKFQRFYDNNADELSGFTGIWRYCIDAADAFTEVEKRTKAEFEYLDAIIDFTSRLLQVGSVLDSTGLRHEANLAITRASY